MGVRDDEDPAELLMDLGDRLVHRRHLLDRGEAQWLELLAEFDRNQHWELDGQTSCVHWLMLRLGMSRGTAFEELRIAHELSRRPTIAQAFTAGDISYSAVRAITRLDRPDPAVDQALVNLAKAGTVRDLEQACRRYQLCAEQERAGTPQAAARRGIHIKRGYDGYSTAEITLEDTELQELLAAIRAATDHLTRPHPAGEEHGGGAGGEAVDESPQGDPTDPATHLAGEEGGGGAGGEAVDESPQDDCAARQRGWKKAVDALLHLIRTGLAHLGEGALAGADRYLVHILHHTDTNHTDTNETELLDGTPIPPTTAERIACDASTVTHLLGENGEPLALGRKTRLWNTAQHRAITIRDHGTCRFPGCTNRITDIHHLQHWTKGGNTDIDNGILLCRHHHTLTHEGYTAAGDANHQVTFHRPDGSILGVG